VKSRIEGVSAAYGRLLTALALLAGALLVAMMMIIVFDVMLRNVPLLRGVHGISWANEITEYALYLITLLIAPWLLRQAQHIRVDIVLSQLPARLAWYVEWFTDIVGLLVCVAIGVYSWKATALSKASGLLAIKTLVLPEWWLITPICICFVLLSIEMVFRMTRLYFQERRARQDSASLN